MVNPPGFGVLQQVRTRRNGVITASNVTTFSNKDLQAHSLIYKHDHSEHREDSFDFVASAVLGRSPTEKSQTAMYNGTFRIQVCTLGTKNFMFFLTK